MNVIFPIEFKYYTITKGTVRADNQNEFRRPGYRLEDKLGCYVTGSTNLATLIGYAVQRDMSAEEAQQFVDRKLAGFSYLADVDIDRRPEPSPGLMVPHHMVQGGGGNGRGGAH